MLTKQAYTAEEELFGLISLLIVLEKNKGRMDVSKALLILPFIFNELTFQELKDKRKKIYGLQDFVAKYPLSVLDFNSKFEEYSSLFFQILKTSVLSGYVSISDQIRLSREGYLFNAKIEILGKKVSDIIKASEKLSVLLQQDSTQLYFTLRIEL